MSSQAFIYKGLIALNNGTFTLQLPVGCHLHGYRRLTVQKVHTKLHRLLRHFHYRIEDDFDQYRISSEAALFADQSGSWEIIDTSSSRGRVMRQMVTEIPISWCSEAPYPYSVLGDSKWQQPLNISADVMIESNGTAFVAVGVSKGSCPVGGVGSPGIVFSINTTNNGLWQLSASTNLTNPLSYGNVSIISSTWYTLTLIVLADHSERIY